MYHLLSLYTVTLLRLWGKCDSLYCLIVFVVLIHMHCLCDKCWYLSSYVRCGTSRPTYANERTAQDMHMTLENQETKLICRNHHLVRFLHWSIPQMRFTCDRHGTEIYAANTWFKGRSADYTWPQVLQWLNSTENHSTFYVLIGVSPPWSYASFLRRPHEPATC